MPNIFQQGDWAKSFEEGMKMAQMQEQGQMQQQQFQQQQAMAKMQMEEFGLKMKDQRTKAEEADRMKKQFKTWQEPTEQTIQAPNPEYVKALGGDAYSVPQNPNAAATIAQKIVGPSQMQQVFGDMAPLINTPGMLEKVLPEAIKNKMAPISPLSDIGKLQADKERYLKLGYPPDHIFIKAIDNEIQKKSTPTEAKPYAASIQDEAYRLVKEQFKKDGVEREPKASEVSSMVTALTNERKTAEYKAMKDVKDEGGFASWKPEAKHNTFMFNAITGEPPVNVKGLAGTDRQAYGKEFAQWQVNQGLTAQDIAVMRADYKSGSMSLNNMKKQEAPMKAFVSNINTQVDYAAELFKGLQRTDARLLNVPLRELKTRVVGSGLERTYELFLQEISMEANKLAQGSSASIAQIPEGNRKEWLRIHDINLPLKEIMPVLEGTKKMANMRLSTWQDAKRGVRDELKAIGTPEQEEPPKPVPNPPLDLTGQKIGRFSVKVK